MIKYVINSSGEKQEFDANKLNGMVSDYGESWSYIALSALNKLNGDTVTTSDIRKAIIQACNEKESNNWSKVAGYYYLKEKRKGVPSRTLIQLHLHLHDIKRMRKLDYSYQEYFELNEYVNEIGYSDDVYSALNRIINKYCIKDEQSGQLIELPKYMYMRVAMGILEDYPRDKRINMVKECYRLLVDKTLNIPTPAYVNAGTDNKSSASCVVLKCDDNADSIGALLHSVYSLTTAGAGIGLNLDTRSIDDSVNNGRIKHGGKLPYLKAIQEIARSTSQGCYDTETEILTQQGFKLFKDLTDDDLVAQVHDDLSVDYVKPTRIIAYHHEGDMIRYKGGLFNLLVTPDHRMIYVKDDEICEDLASNFDFSSDADYGLSMSVAKTKVGDYPYHIITHCDINGVEKSVEKYDDMVYCVEVPTNKIIVKHKHGSGEVVCGNSRGGAVTSFITALDPEIYDLIKLRNPTQIESKRIPKMDIGVIYNNSFIERVKNNDKWLLISKNDAPDLYESMYDDNCDKFDELFEHYVSNGIGEVVKARDIALEISRETYVTGRIYWFNATNVNYNSPFTDRIYSSNLCCEVSLPTKGFNSISDLNDVNSDGEIGLCNLSSINAYNMIMATPEERKNIYNIALTFVNSMINQANHIFDNLNFKSRERMTAGIGLTNMAYAIAKAGTDFRDLEYVDKIASQHCYHLYYASSSKEMIDLFGRTQREKPEWLPIDTANDEIIKEYSVSKVDWESLRTRIKNNGIVNQTLIAHAPNESSSIASNTTNGVYPVKMLVVNKIDGKNNSNFVAPEIDKLDYQLASDLSFKDMVKYYAVLQRYADQAISADFYHVYDDTTLSSKKLLSDFVVHSKYGLKTKYYTDTQTTGVGKDDVCESCSI